MTEYAFTVVIERDEDGWYIAHVPALPGCHTQGETEVEAYELIQDAARLHVQARLERGESISPEVSTGTVKIAV